MRPFYDELDIRGFAEHASGNFCCYVRDLADRPARCFVAFEPVIRYYDEKRPLFPRELR